MTIKPLQYINSLYWLNELDTSMAARGDNNTWTFLITFDPNSRFLSKFTCYLSELCCATSNCYKVIDSRRHTYTSAIAEQSADVHDVWKKKSDIYKTGARFVLL